MIHVPQPQHASTRNDKRTAAASPTGGDERGPPGRQTTDLVQRRDQRADADRGALHAPGLPSRAVQPQLGNAGDAIADGSGRTHRHGGVGGSAGAFAGYRRRVDERAAGPGSVDGIRRTRRRCPRSDERATTARPRPSAEFLHQPEHLSDPRRAVGTTFLRRHLPHAPVAGLVGAGRRGRVVRAGAAQRVRYPQAVSCRQPAHKRGPTHRPNKRSATPKSYRPWAC